MNLHRVALLLIGVGCASGEALESRECGYWARESERHPTPEDQEMQPRGFCASLQRDGSIVVQPEHLRDLSFEDGLAQILAYGEWYYVTPDGRGVSVLPLDNGPDTFEEGLARTRRAGKVGFIDRDLNVVIPPTWDEAFPFLDGFAVVCDGCREHRMDEDDEHPMLRGGVWGYIDHSGALVEPLRYERDALPPPPR